MRVASEQSAFFFLNAAAAAAAEKECAELIIAVTADETLRADPVRKASLEKGQAQAAKKGDILETAPALLLLRACD